ncbi:MAG: hypothetical protein HeimC3_48410 [Candidatus Heimdallarchaeota archaeon LC_3]|nr:MAG: hypothetical protein HeimC3_48410 [Candidatus Heimdallarchaeota archaeon LC_3]
MDFDKGTLSVSIVPADFKKFLDFFDSSNFWKILNTSNRGYFIRFLSVLRSSGFSRVGINTGLTVGLNTYFNDPEDFKKEILNEISHIELNYLQFNWIIPYYDSLESPSLYSTFDEEVLEFCDGFFVIIKFEYREESGRVSTVAARSRLLLGGDYAGNVGRTMSIAKNAKQNIFIFDDKKKINKDLKPIIELKPIQFSLLYQELKSIKNRKGRSIGASYLYEVTKEKLSKDNISDVYKAFSNKFNQHKAFKLDYFGILTTILEEY